MLMITRTHREGSNAVAIILDEETLAKVTITVVKRRKGTLALMFDAPQHIRIVRGELLEQDTSACRVIPPGQPGEDDIVDLSPLKEQVSRGIADTHFDVESEK